MGSNVEKEDTQNGCSYRSAPDCSIGSLLTSSHLEESGGQICGNSLFELGQQ